MLAAVRKCTHHSFVAWSEITEQSRLTYTIWYPVAYTWVADWKEKLINLWKYTSLAKGLIKWEMKAGHVWPPGKACGIHSAPSGWARLRLSGPYHSSRLLSQCEESNQMQMPPCLCLILPPILTVVGNCIAGFCSLDTVQARVCTHKAVTWL